MDKLMFDRDRLYRLCTAYGLAAAHNLKEFEFEGHRLVTDYAKYLIEFVSDKLEKEEKKHGPKQQ